MTAIELWMTMRERPLEREVDYLFCGYMYTCLPDLEIVRLFLNTGYCHGRIEREFNAGRELFYQKGINEVIRYREEN